MLELHLRDDQRTSPVPGQADGVPLPLWMPGLACCQLANCNRDGWKQWPAQLGNTQVTWDDVVLGQGSAHDGQIRLVGDWSHVYGIARGMTAGQMEIDGSAGPVVGWEMTGGTILIQGDADDGVGREMKGGLIVVRGNTGDGVGGPRPGANQGMAGGTILIHGSAGLRVGERCRRGLIAVAEGCAGYAGLDMIAGTLIVGQTLGPAPGLGNKRGTLLLAEPDKALLEMPVTYRAAGWSDPVYLQLLAQFLAEHRWPIPLADVDGRVGRYRRYIGDSLTLGKGELMVADFPEL